MVATFCAEVSREAAAEVAAEGAVASVSISFELCYIFVSIETKKRTFIVEGGVRSPCGMYRAARDIQTTNGATKIFRNVFFEPVRPGKRFQIQVFCVAVDSVKFSYKSELSAIFRPFEIFRAV